MTGGCPVTSSDLFTDRLGRPMPPRSNAGPGNTIAMIEAQVLLERLLRRDVELIGEPRIEWEDLIAGYAVRGLVLRQGARS